MGLDVRIPIGLMFSILGLLLVVYGVATLHAPGMRPTGLPINLIWGIVMLVFGAAMLALFRRSERSAPPGERPAAPGAQERPPS
jgi:uncharacterized membrane protein HdeD (DUF308 family)